MPLPDVYITGIGTKLGSEEVSLQQIGRRFALTAAQLKQLRRKCGPIRLYRCAPDESVEDCAVQACQTAMCNAALSASDVTGIYASTGGPVGEYVLPDLPRTLALKLGMGDLDTIGMSMGCVGGVDCMLAASHRLIVDSLEGRTASYLIVCGDQAGLTHSAMDRSTAFLFSEGMACFVLSNHARAGYRIERINTVSAAGDPFCMKLRNAHSQPGAKFEMQGEAVYEFVIKAALPRLPRLLGLASIPKDAYCIFHQANLSMLRQMAAQADLHGDLVYDDGVREIGNTSGASLMFGLEDALRKGYIGRTPRVFLGTFGVGLKVGAALLSPIGDPREVTRAANPVYSRLIANECEYSGDTAATSSH